MFCICQRIGGGCALSGLSRVAVTLGMLVVMLFPVVSNASQKLTCSKKTLCIETVKNKGAVVFYATNKQAYDVSFTIYVDSKNMESSMSLPATFILERRERRQLFTLRFDDKPWNYNYHFEWARGRMGVVHNDNYVYNLPYTNVRPYRVTQSCNGTFTHNGKAQYAVDFKMPEGTPVLAAREGLVVRTKADSSRGGNSKEYISDGNFVLIEHDDGTIAEYAHLRQNGVSVRTGQRVNRADVIGYSGNTGYSRGPHLHFVVQSTPDGKTTVSHPTRFSTHIGIVKCPPRNTYLLPDLL
ncbi:MAG: hypothetical protein CVV05_16275 [Gammaproteobacteria bacterium HGW-Gammaproteobacteria-1]|nr:MAG: hypothetical protein CVV05_16275 [Gammaproteobacteria bacterium HGW-Gammaproteobacteria-1]